jgi:hypothetical protein
MNASMNDTHNLGKQHLSTPLHQVLQFFSSVEADTSPERPGEHFATTNCK